MTDYDRQIELMADAIYREKVLRARSQSIEEKLALGADLYTYATSITLAGIRNQHPEWTEEQVRAELRRRIALSRRLERSDAGGAR
ncbi:MAG TPA: hypothetical protein VEA69_19745 [Tepidisphaeraceae bacterium]|nr:hypothetical protein [Tepidisphaeraceae bacterium]